MRRVNCQRCEHRQNLIEKISFQPAYLIGRKLMLLMHENTGIAQIGEQIVKRFLLIIHQRIGNLGHALQLLGGSQVILALTSTPAFACPTRPATRTMKNSSRLLAEIDKKRKRSKTG